MLTGVATDNQDKVYAQLGRMKEFQKEHESILTHLISILIDYFVYIFLVMDFSFNKLM